MYGRQIQTKNEFRTSFSLPNDQLKVVSIRQVAKLKRTFIIALIAVLQLIGWIVFLGIKASHNFNDSLNVFQSISVSMSDVGFVWFTIASSLAVIGLMKMKSWGWVCAIIANALWISLFTSSIDQSLYVNTLFEKIFLIFFAVFAVLSSFYLWAKRYVFWR